MNKKNLIWMIGLIFIISLSYVNAVTGGGSCLNIGQACIPGGTTSCCGNTQCINEGGVGPTCQCPAGTISCQQVCDQGGYDNKCVTPPATQTTCGCGGTPPQDPCAGITCNNPPNECTENPGNCSNGSCIYPADPEKNNFPCDDGSLCTINDKCLNGYCVGKPINCGANSYCDETSGSCECKPGYAKCGKACVDLQTNGNNCGSCGNVCPASNICSSGVCVYLAGCGNGWLDENEECDGTNFGGVTCASYGFYSGSLSCSGCFINHSGCHAECGNGHCEIGEDNYNCLMDCPLAGWTFAKPSQPSFIKKLFGQPAKILTNAWVGNPYFNLNKTRYLSAPNSIMAHLNTSGEPAMYYSYNLNLTPGKYILSGWIWNNLSQGNAYINFYDNSDLQNQCGDSLNSTLGNNNWEKVECQFNVTNYINTTIMLVINGCSENDCGYVWFDDISLIKINETPNIPTILDTYNFTQQGCCPANWCWNGTGCMNSSLWEENTSYPAIFTTGSNSGYRCIGGKWVYSEVKWNWDHTDAQFCPSNNHCFVSASQGCVESGSYIDDHYCWEGNWSSRTKFMAMQLLQFAKNNSYSEYTLQCDNYENALNDFTFEENYFRKGNDPTYTYLVNNFCSLKWRDGDKEKVIIGTSFNEGFTIQDFLKNVTNTTETYCNNVANNGNFSACSPQVDGKSPIWYNANKSIVLYSKEPFTLTPPNDWMTRFLGWLGTTFGFLHPDLENLDLTMNITDFNKIYISRLYSGCEKSIFAVNEIKSNQHTYHLQYKNFVADICNATLTKYPSALDCVSINMSEKGVFQIITPIDISWIAEDIWQDLTSKLRIKEGACPKKNIKSENIE